MGILRIIATLALAMSLVGCNIQDSEVSDFKKLDADAYGKSFEALLNYMDGGDSTELDTELLSDAVIKYVESLRVEEDGLNEGVTYAEEEELDPNEPIYPLYDIYGHIIGYVTLEESEMSREAYDEMPVYTVLFSEQHGDELYFKVYDKWILESAIYVASLDKDYKIASFRELS